MDMLVENLRLADEHHIDRVFGSTAEVTGSLRPLDPVYLFSEQRLLAQSRYFQSHFPGLCSFAVKANPSPLILSTLMHSGIDTFDVASLEEIRLVKQLQAQATLHFNNPVKASEAIEQAYWAYGVRAFVIDDEHELDKIAAIVAVKEDVEISVRFKLDVNNAVYDFSSKFGADPALAASLLQACQRKGFQVSLTFHPGSQCTSPLAYVEHIRAAAEICRHAGLSIQRLNVGGGFPATYANASAPPLDQYFSLIKQTFHTEFSDSDTRLLCEPGRSLVASSCSLLTRVIHRRNNHTLFLNDGVYGGLMEQMLVDIRLPMMVWRNGKRLNGPMQTFQLFGPTCDAIDKLQTAPLPADIQTEDYIEFGSMGAYGSSTTTGFNGFRSDLYYRVAKCSRF